MKLVWKSKPAFLFLLLSLAAAPPTSALASESFQPTLDDPLMEPWRWRVFPELSGLGLQCIAEGKDQTMWFGAAEGAWSYDGMQWTGYGAKEGLPGSVDTLCASADGSVYAGGVWGLSHFQKDKWKRVLPLEKQSFGAIKQLTMGRDGTLWAATSWGVLRHKGSDWVLYTGMEGATAMDRNPLSPMVRLEMLPDSVLAKPRDTDEPTNRFDFFEVYEDHQGRIWLGTEAGRGALFQAGCGQGSAHGIPAGPGGEWVLYAESEGLGLNLRPRILQLQDGTVWVVNYGSPGRAAQFDGTRWKSQRLQEIGAPDDCNSLLQTSDGVFWVGCNGAWPPIATAIGRCMSRRRCPSPRCAPFCSRAPTARCGLQGRTRKCSGLIIKRPGGRPIRR